MGSIQNQPKTSKDEEDCQFAMQLASSSILPMALKAVIELEVLEIIAKAGVGVCLSPSEIASQLPTQNPEAPTMLDRIMRLLASYSIVTCSLLTGEDGEVQRLYGLAPVCKFLIRNEEGASLSALLLLNQDRVFMESWYHLKDAILEGGIPFNKAYRMSAFEYPNKDPRFNEEFNKGMWNHSTVTMRKILEMYDGFEGLEQLVDVAGGVGTSLKMIISKYPQIKGVNFDLPHVIASAPAFPGMENVEGDMFTSIPSGDAIFMKWILHDWSDEHCLKILKNCYQALPSSGKVIVVESILLVAPEDNHAAHSIFQMDLIMLAHNPGGKERTKKEFEALAGGAGFAGFRALYCVYNNWIMEFYKTV
eukprot:TRINITY_DN1827_c1_g1_i1.p1 TRINITY_DN1827_c1_g1~~TRINITY_DN1827_c1_g1_i1.p1  ORF type:complete len:371 (-),score=51.89 TRINITY_DN1827_c1_g1_i1:53-1141(-)